MKLHFLTVFWPEQDTEIIKHLTVEEKRRFGKVGAFSGLLFGLLGAGISFGFVFHHFIASGISLVLFIAVIFLLRRYNRHLLYLTEWAKNQGYSESHNPPKTS
ncbi:MAG TPA: hypothetical protein VLX68_03445 [Chitinivibrionales bacterium]|nr:hypothetical protein [Chitinivibrionales bacterium]